MLNFANYRQTIDNTKARLSRSNIKKMRPSTAHAPIFLRKKTHDMGTYQKVFKDREYDIELAHEPKVIVDCGAHIGCASVFFAQCYPKARIIALEPEHSNFSMLTYNVSTYPNITPIKAAVWHDQAQLNVSDWGNGTWAYRVGQGGASVSHVQSVTVDGLMSLVGIKPIDLLKVDIEGAEKEVFDHCSGWIDCVQAIAIEIHDWRKGARHSINRAASDFDYHKTNGENDVFSRAN